LRTTELATKVYIAPDHALLTADLHR